MVAGLSVCRSNQLSAQAGQVKARAIRAAAIVIVSQFVLWFMRILLRLDLRTLNRFPALPQRLRIAKIREIRESIPHKIGKQAELLAGRESDQLKESSALAGFRQA
jgi:hypothetical protein